MTEKRCIKIECCYQAEGAPLTRRELLLGFAGAAALPLLAGCGGGSKTVKSAGKKGQATMTILWPARSRLIPDTANYVRVKVTDLTGNAISGVTVTDQTGNPLPLPASSLKDGSGNAIANAVVAVPQGNNRQTSTLVFNGLPVSRDSTKPNVLFVSESFSTAALDNTTNPSDPAKNAVSRGAQSLAISDTAANQININMASTVVSLGITASPSNTVMVGDKVTFMVTGYDGPNATGNQVLLADNQVQWSQSGTTGLLFASTTGIMVKATVVDNIPTGSVTAAENQVGRSMSLSFRANQLVYTGGIDAGVAGGAGAAGDISASYAVSRAPTYSAYQDLNSSDIHLQSFTQSGGSTDTFLFSISGTIARIALNSAGLVVGYGFGNSYLQAYNVDGSKIGSHIGDTLWQVNLGYMAAIYDIVATERYTYLATNLVFGGPASIVRYDNATGQNPTNVPLSLQNSPTTLPGIAVDENDALYIPYNAAASGPARWTIAKVDASNSGTVLTFNSPDSKFQTIKDIAYDSGLLYVLDSAAKQVYILSITGNYIQTLPASGQTALIQPKYITVANRVVFVTDANADPTMPDVVHVYTL